jgi:hypothetical protein
MLFANLTCHVVLRFSLILLHSNRFDLIDYPECLYFCYQTFEKLSGAVSEVILSLSLTDSGILTK